jgi:ABC-2 type transport system permease protein
LNPVRWYAEVMRATLLRGAGFGDLVVPLGALAVLGGALLALATSRFHRRLG